MSEEIISLKDFEITEETILLEDFEIPEEIISLENFEIPEEIINNRDFLMWWCKKYSPELIRNTIYFGEFELLIEFTSKNYSEEQMNKFIEEYDLKHIRKPKAIKYPDQGF